jgi:hypothetical protein
MAYAETDLDGLGLSEAERSAIMEDNGDTDTEDENGLESASEDLAPENDDSAEAETADSDPVEADTPKEGPDLGANGDLTKAELAQMRAQYERGPSIPGYVPEVPADIDQQLGSLKDERKALVAKFSEGEIDLEEYEAARDELQGREQDIRDIKTAATVAQKQQEYAVQRHQEFLRELWAKEQSVFLSQPQNKMYGQDAPKVLLNAAIQKLAANPDNNHKSPMFFLTEADRMTRAWLSQGHAAVSDSRQTSDRSRRQSRHADLPPDIGGAPSAELPETGDGGEFAYLDRLSGARLEAELGRLSDEQQRRYRMSS